MLIHHPPVSTRAHYFRRLIDGAALRDVLRAARRRAGAARPRPRCSRCIWLAGPAASHAGASACRRPPARRAGEDDPAGYNLYRIEAQPGAWRCAMIARGLRDGGLAEIGRCDAASALDG